MSAFFSSAETALMTVSNIRLRTLAQSGRKNALILLKILDKKEKMLSAILIGNNIVNLSASALATSLSIKLWGDYAVGLATGVLTLLVLVFGEISPKTLASRYSEDLAMFYAKPIYALMFILTPLIFLVNIFAGAVLFLFGANTRSSKEHITEEEIRTIVDVGHEEGILENEERKMINNVFDFGDTIVRDVMTPRIDMVAIDITADFDELISLYRQEQYTRIPVYEESTDNIVGIINVKDLLLNDNKKDFKIKDILREPLFTYEHQSLAKLFMEMKKNFHNIVIVLDEYGTAAGLLTLEDILEEIFGDIRDEYDRDEEESIKKLGEKEYLVDASMKLGDINEYFNIDLSSEDYESIGGLVLEKLGHLPEENEELEVSDIRIKVEKMAKNRIDTLRLYL
jgi:hypothetical protein